MWETYLNCREKHAQVLDHCSSAFFTNSQNDRRLAVGLILSFVPCPQFAVPSPKDPGNEGW